MYLTKYIFGQTVTYYGVRRKIEKIRFTPNGTWYKLLGIKEWVKESEIIG